MTAVPPTTAAQPPASGSRLVVRTRPFDAVLTGGAAAVLGGIAWWAAASLLELDWWEYGSLIVGVLVGFGTLLGARRGGVVPGVIALVFATVATVVGAYFIDRSLTIAALGDLDITNDIPLWSGFSAFTDVFTDGVDADPVRAAGWLLGPLAALLVAALGRRD